MIEFIDLNLKFLLILAISVFMSSLNFMLSWVENVNVFVLIHCDSIIIRIQTDQADLPISKKQIMWCKPSLTKSTAEMF